ncbi:MAG: hypothetical protein U1E02_26305 [Hydrogenophaga sp.]|nr:hypothetical protein [Hydrogenophaga sp.]
MDSLVQRIAVHAAALRDVELLHWAGLRRVGGQADAVSDTQWQDTAWDQSVTAAPDEIRTTRHWGHVCPPGFETESASQAADAP